MEGRIIKLISNDYTVLSNHQQYVCKCKGKLRNQKIHPVVGDFVQFDSQNRMIEMVLPRKNVLIRPPVSNIDQAIIVTSAKDPLFKTSLLDRQLVRIEYHNIIPIICFTKLDLLTEEELSDLNPIINYYQSIGYSIYQNTEIEALKKLFADKISVFTGQSGVGKSTLLNRLNPMLHLKTDQISYALGRGKHTTRHVELLSFDSGFVADTPGFSAMDFSDMSTADIRDQFVEFNQYRHLCKYQDCMHDKEIDCYIKKLVEEGIILKSRYENYMKLIEVKR